MPLYDFILLVTKYAVAGLFLGCILLFVVIPLFRGLNQGMPDFPHAPPCKQGQPTPQPPTQDFHSPVGKSSSKPMERTKDIIELAKKNPQQTAQILRNWLRKDKEP